jgi:hypothetical protein
MYTPAGGYGGEMQAKAEIPTQPAIRASVPLPQRAIDLQRDAAHGQQGSPVFRLAGAFRATSRSNPDAKAFPKVLPKALYDLVSIFHAFAIHGKRSYLRAITGEPPVPWQYPPRWRSRTSFLPSNPVCVAEFPAPGAGPALPQKHCAAQAEYDRLAAQAYSPSAAMSQACSWSGSQPKGSTPVAANRPSDFVR